MGGLILPFGFCLWGVNLAIYVLFMGGLTLPIRFCGGLSLSLGSCLLGG